VVVGAAAGDGFPEAVAHVHHLVLLGVFHVGRERQARRIVCEQRCDVLLHQPFETGAVAVGRNRFGLGDEVRRKDAAGDHQQGNGNETGNSHACAPCGADYIHPCRLQMLIARSFYPVF